MSGIMDIKYTLPQDETCRRTARMQRSKLIYITNWKA